MKRIRETKSVSGDSSLNGHVRGVLDRDVDMEKPPLGGFPGFDVMIVGQALASTRWPLRR